MESSLHRTRNGSLYDDAVDVASNKPADANPTETRTYIASTAYQKERYGYDDAGRMRWTEDAKRNRTTTAYAPEHTWPLDGITTTTPKPSNDLADMRGALSTTVWKSRFWGLPYQTKDANGNLTKLTLDAAGRLTEVWKPTETGTSPSMKFSYSIPTSPSNGIPDSVDGFPRVASHILQSGSTYLSSYAYTDGLGRSRETQTPIPDGIDSTGAEVPNRQVAVTRYDTAGHVTGTSAVFRNQGTAGSGGPVSPKVEDLPSYTDLTLDWAGRTTRSQIMVGDGTQSTATIFGRVLTAYHGDYTRVIPAAARPVDTYTNVYGQTSKVVEHADGTTFTTQYAYTAAGALKQITDPLGNLTFYNYDWAGQRIRTVDPDAGVSTTTYNENGQIDQTTSRRDRDPVTGHSSEVVLTYGYDNLGRKTSVSNGTTVLASWSWDGLSVPGGKGQIVAATSRDTDGTTYTTKTSRFDTRGRPLSSTVSIPTKVTGLAGDYTTSLTYDAADHVTSITYPQAGGLGAETVTTTYNSYGQPTRLASGLDTYVRSTVYDAYGLLTDRHYGAPTDPVSGVAAQRTYDYNYANGTRWLRSITTNTTVGRYVSENQQDVYVHDHDGKISELREVAGDLLTRHSQCFRYDDQARLTHAYTRASESCSIGTTSDFRTQGAYQTAYSYDPLGNLQSVTDTKSSGAAETRDYLYPGYDDNGTWTTANAKWPHGVRKINTVSGGTTSATESFTYDDAGQMDTRIKPGQTTDYNWTKLGQLSTVKTTDSGGSRLTRYTYDADGTLLVRTTPEETVASIGGMQLRTTDGIKVTATRYYSSGNSVVAMRTTEATSAVNGKLTYLMADTQASTQLAVDATTGTTTRRRYTPFGDEHNGTLPTGTDRGFLGKTEDTSTGLTLLGARAYDPHLSRFLSPDPLSKPYDPQNLSAYSYSRNDPINYADPSGLIEAECNGTGWQECGSGPPSPGGAGGDDNPDVAAAPPAQAPDCSGYGYMVLDACLRQNTSKDKDHSGFWVEAAAITVNAITFSLCQSVAVGVTGPAGLLATGSCIAGSGAAGAAVRDAVDGDAESTGEALANQAEGAAYNLVAGAALKAAAALRGQIAKLCSKNSFLPEEDVRMADGTVKKIKDVKVGDKVLATDPETGQTEARSVLATIITKDDKAFTELTVKTRRGKSTLIATDRHPFWSPSEHAWIDTADLETGMTLRTDMGGEVEIVATRSYRDRQETRNLTVDGIHTYYVLAGQTPVLVHNSNGCVNWASKSVKTWGHTFKTHGAGAKKTQALTDRARSTGNEQGQWLDDDAAAEFLKGLHVEGAGPRSVRIPDGLGQVIMPDGSIVQARAATIVPSPNGLYKTGYPIIGPN
jgi:RHS repeat-associated protein